MRNIIVDTSVIIDFLRREDIDQTLFYQIAHNNLYISVMTHTELYSGKSVWSSKRVRKELEDLLSGITLLSIEEPISKLAGKIRAATGVAITDCIIASTAITNDCELATLNIKDFSKVPELVLYEHE